MLWLAALMVRLQFQAAPQSGERQPQHLSRSYQLSLCALTPVTKYWIGAPSRCTQPTSTTVVVHMPKLRPEQRTEVPELPAVAAVD